MQFAAAGDGPTVGCVRGRDRKRDIGFQFFFKPVFQVARGCVGSFLAAERRRVHAEGHLDRRFVDCDRGKRDRMLGVGDRLTDGNVRNAGDGNDIPRLSHSTSTRFKPVKKHHRSELLKLDLALAGDMRDGLLLF